MSKEKNRKQDDKRNIYPSDYIDYTPASNRPKSLNIAFATVALSIAFLLIIWSSFLRTSNPSDLSDFPESIEEISYSVNTINDELDKLNKEFEDLVEKEAPKLNEFALSDFQSVRKSISDISFLLDQIEEFLKSESDRLENILKTDIFKSN